MGDADDDVPDLYTLKIGFEITGSISKNVTAQYSEALKDTLIYVLDLYKLEGGTYSIEPGVDVLPPEQFDITDPGIRVNNRRSLDALALSKEGEEEEHLNNERRNLGGVWGEKRKMGFLYTVTVDVSSNADRKEAYIEGGTLNVETWVQETLQASVERPADLRQDDSEGWNGEPTCPKDLENTKRKFKMEGFNTERTVPPYILEDKSFMSIVLYYIECYCIANIDNADDFPMSVEDKSQNKFILFTAPTWELNSTGPWYNRNVDPPTISNVYVANAAPTASPTHLKRVIGEDKPADYLADVVIFVCGGIVALIVLVMMVKYMYRRYSRKRNRSVRQTLKSLKKSIKQAGESKSASASSSKVAPIAEAPIEGMWQAATPISVVPEAHIAMQTPL